MELRIGVITGSTRGGNRGAAIGDAVLAALAGRPDIEIADLRVADFDLALLADPVLPAHADGRYADPATARWAAAVAPCEAFIFVTPEYNAAPPAAMKNAVDLLWAEWRAKPVGFVGYAFNGAVRAISHWRDITANLGMRVVQPAVTVNLATDYPDGGSFTPAGDFAERLHGLVDALLAERG